MNVTIYCRVSTDEQAASGLGLAAQVAACESFASKAGYTVTGLHTDAGVSGAAGIEDRPGLTAAVAGLRRGDALVIAKRCRLGRDAFVIAMIEKAVSRKGASILSADGVGNGTSRRGPSRGHHQHSSGHCKQEDGGAAGCNDPDTGNKYACLPI